jgi:hypothetical protein
MTVPSTASEIAYATDGVTVDFGIPFAFDTSADIVAKLTDSNGNIVPFTAYSVSGGSGSIGTLTTNSVLASGSTLTIYDDPEQSQETDYVDNDPFPATSHERALDKLTRLIKRLSKRLERSLRTADGDPITDLTLGSVEQRKGKFLFFDVITGAIDYAVGLAGAALSSSNVRAALNDAGYRYVIHPMESAAGYVSGDLTFGFEAGDVRRYGVSATGSGATNRTLIEEALTIGLTIFGGDGEAYPVTGTIVRTGNVKIRGLKLRPTSAAKVLQIQGTFKASTTLAADVRIGRDVITLTSVANVADGDLLLIESDAAWPYDQGAEGLLKGETTQARSKSGSDVTLAMSTQCEYNLPGETVTVTPVTPAVVDLDLDIGWDTPALAAALGLDGCMGRVRGRFFGAQSVGIGPVNCFGLDISQARVEDCFFTGLGYGIQFSGSSQCSVRGSYITNNRRGVDVSGGYPSHQIATDGNTVIGNKAEGSCVGGHGTGNNCSFTNNLLSNSIIGVQIRGPNTLVQGNKYSDVTSFCTINLAPGQKILGNHEFRQGIPQTIGIPDNLCNFFVEIAGAPATLNSIASAPIIIEGNSGTMGVDVIFLGSGVTALSNVKFNRNNFHLENNSGGAQVRVIESTDPCTFDATCEMSGNWVRNISGQFATAFTNVTFNGRVNSPNTFLNGSTLIDYTPETGNFTATATGMTASITGTARYHRIGNRVTLKIPGLLGTSNTTSCTITGLPAAIQPATTQQFYIVPVQNNSVDAAGMASVTGGTITLHKDPNSAANAFTNSGGKGTAGFEITYQMD